MTATAFPLQWPEGWKRTLAHERQEARYKISDDKAIRNLIAELRRMGAPPSTIVLSTNIVLRSDGLPYSRQPGHAIMDPGAAVYWSTTRFKDRVIACDKWRNVYHNIHALGLAIGAMRALERAGASQVMERAFEAFGALPAAAQAPVTRPWWEVLGLEQQVALVVPLPMLEAQYRELARKAHPDQGGSVAAMTELNRAIESAREHHGNRQSENA